MKVNSITINNFQSYYGEQTIEFGDGLNLVIGNGGKGKSKLFNAFYWVLFGKIYVTSEGWCVTDDLYKSSRKALHKYEYINKKALHDAEINDTVNCFVRLYLVDDKGREYVIERQSSAVRQSQQEWNLPEAWEVSMSSFKVTHEISTGNKTVSGILADNIIANLFPEGIRGYIWFQGESLDSLIDFRKKDNLKDAVRHISYYPYYEKLTAIITKAKAKIEFQESKKLKELYKQSSEIKALVTKRDLLSQQKRQEEANKQKYQNEIAQIEISLTEDETKLQGIAGFVELERAWQECDKEILKINNQINELDKRQRELLPTIWILRGVDKLVEQSKTIISSHVEEVCTEPEKKFLGEPTKEKLEEILKEHRCFVCGSPVDEEHPHAVQWIVNRLRSQEDYFKALDDYRNTLALSARFNVLMGHISSFPDSVLRSLKLIDQNYQDSETEIEKLQATRRKLQAKKDEVEKKIELVKQKSGLDPHREAGSHIILSSNIKASRSTLEKRRKLLEACKSEIANLTIQLENVERELEKLGESNGTIKQVIETKWRNISTFLEEICKDVQEKARKDLLLKIEERANYFYERFTEHDKGYKGRVEIEEDYSISFDGGLNTSHEDRKKMSIINALLSLNQEALGTYYPFISDAPTSSFDPSTTHKYLMGIKDIFGQSIIMTKDVEVGSSMYNDLYDQAKVSRIFLLDSQVYVENAKEPEIWEVSTVVKTLK